MEDYLVTNVCLPNCIANGFDLAPVTSVRQLIHEQFEAGTSQTLSRILKPKVAFRLGLSLPVDTTIDMESVPRVIV